MSYDLTKYKSDWVDNIKKKKDFLDKLKKILTIDGTDWSIDTEVNAPWEDKDEVDMTPVCSQEMAQRIMDALCADGRGDFLILKDDEIREWWASITKQRKAESRSEEHTSELQSH